MPLIPLNAFIKPHTLCIVSLIFLVRFVSIFLVTTSFVPDEYWQSLEVAHKMTFGYGYLTWEWKKKIRSYIYPFLFHILYSVLPDSLDMLVFAPRLLQAILSTIGDFYTYKLSAKLFGEKCSEWTLFNLLTSWFLFYCSSRTITNMSETSLTACGFYFYPWHKTKGKGLNCSYIFFAGLSTLMRPTAVVIWMPLYLYHVWREEEYLHLARKTLFYGSIILSILVACDRYFYGEWVLTPYNFFLFNWSSDIGAFYGQHELFWHFYAGLPVVLGLHLLPFLIGINIPQLRRFYYLIFWVMVVFSLLSHKEFRFLLPILPLALVLCSAVMSEISSNRIVICGCRLKEHTNTLFILVVLLINLPFSVYMGLLHQRGTISSVSYLSSLVHENSSVLFLMPCHSTPLYSFIHRDISMKFLTCEPNFSNDDLYEDEADSFYRSPSIWLFQEYSGVDSQHLPSHVILFDSLLEHISDFLRKYNYQLCYQTFHSHFPDKRTGNFVIIFCK